MPTSLIRIFEFSESDSLLGETIVELGGPVELEGSLELRRSLELPDRSELVVLSSDDEDGELSSLSLRPFLSLLSLLSWSFKLISFAFDLASDPGCT